MKEKFEDLVKTKMLPEGNTNVGDGIQKDVMAYSSLNNGKLSTISKGNKNKKTKYKQARSHRW